MTTPDHARIADYYRKTWYDYRGVWMNKTNRAMHYGYRDARTVDHAASLLRMNHELATLAGIPRGARVLDAGCGVGGSSMWLAERYDATVVGITLSEFQVGKARGYAAERSLSQRVEFRSADYSDTGFPDDSFDVVWAQESVCYARDKGDFLREAFRVLRPGGRVAVEDGFRFRRDLPARDEALILDWADAWAFPDLDTIDEFRTSAKEAGFVDIVDRDVTTHAMRSARRLRRAAGLFAGPSWLACKAGLRPREAHRNLIGARRQWDVLGGGLCGISLVAARKPE
ncbi:methyltransferase domain-containing protein [Nocardia blacklockiae]|uniref:methyltransferase domain-containing protein n=1 Tax=Nocardia blacklockiae TaxID=480036 RepID=UPI00189533E2|nr:methyltransferase domain-containing protein [Nocardia blacklockiae]MBF6169870.1 methyltransferase domain-containing protein [Nocardia blacklockiae]